MIFLDEMEQLADEADKYELNLQLTREMGKFDVSRMDEWAPDWRERECWACGPVALLDAMEAHYEDGGLRERLHIERFTIARTDHGGEGGTVRFAISDKEVEVDGATTLLEAGEDLGIQMLRVPDGDLPDLRRPAGGWVRARPAHRRRTSRRRTNPDLHQCSVR